jgi:3-oxoacyl-[acyl-carrier protein] reductase
MNLLLKGKKALVSGGTHGIGEAIALGLAKEGCSICVFSRTQERVDAMKAKLDAMGVDNICLTADVLDEESYKNVETAVNSQWGGVDIVINNIGGGGRWGDPDMLKTKDFTWREVYDKNLTSTMKYTKMFLPYMLKNKWGRVVAITSIYGKQAGGRPWFNVAKSAQTTLMKNLAINKEYASAGITFNSVAPGGIWIPNTGWEQQQQDNPEEFKKFIYNKFPRGSMGTPEEVANLVVFLSSPLASLVNGASISADGGESVYF